MIPSPALKGKTAKQARGWTCAGRICARRRLYDDERGVRAANAHNQRLNYAAGALRRDSKSPRRRDNGRLVFSVNDPSNGHCSKTLRLCINDRDMAGAPKNSTADEPRPVASFQGPIAVVRSLRVRSARQANRRQRQSEVGHEHLRELSPNFGDGRSRSGGGGYGLTGSA